MTDLEKIRPLIEIMTREHVQDPSMFDDCVQEGLIRAWQMEGRGYSPTQVNKALRRRIKEVSQDQVFFGHVAPEPETCGEWMPRAKQSCARAPFHAGDHNTAKAARRKMIRTFAPIDPLRQRHDSLDLMRENEE